MAAKKLKNLDVQNLYQLNMPSQLALAGLIVVIVLALGYAALFRSQLDTLTQQQDKETKLKETYTQKSIEAGSLNNLKAELSSIRSAFDVLLRQLPTDAEIPNLIQELHQAGSDNGLRLDSVIPQSPSNDGPIQKLPYEIAVTGKYQQISQFTRDVGELSRIITLDSIKIQPNIGKNNKDSKNDSLTLSATATTYKARPAEEVAAELAATQEKQDKANGKGSNKSKKNKKKKG
ncbi:type 4a pilus biogenesis protein PilO [Neisseria perflava]|uniref:type 4a pilus biogenesis protein PilO n=1 Tax=Neisseria perflava TaxID=33053 RepID=UPI00209E075A|nr:type 4a pilus biogenesis protein PilO [Neisseria perflava]MCP1659221.1 type IV pilus assembly protein PilO [Neisseria perflava]MCP1771737.1 type IV pilus assembly protein PilO [Neisseria perflava]